MKRAPVNSIIISENALASSMSTCWYSVICYCWIRMKIIAFILSVYILFLTAVPCIDKPEDYAVAKSEISPLTKNHNHQDCDHCSPFCTCNCCSSPKIQQTVAIVFVNFELITEYVPVYLPGISSSPSTRIWQPPQFS